MIAVLPGLAVDPEARGADHRRGQRRRDRRRAVPRARLRHPVRRRRAPSWACRSCKLGMHAGMAGTYLLPNVVGDGARPRPAAHRPGRRRRRGAAARPGLAGDRARRRSATRCCDRGRDRRHRADRQPADQARAGRRRARDLEACLQWEALAQPITLATADLQEGIAGQPREATRRSSRDADHVKRPPARLATLAFPLRMSLDGPGASSGREPWSGRGRGQSHAATTPVDNLWTSLWTTGDPGGNPRSGPGRGCGGHARGSRRTRP